MPHLTEEAVDFVIGQLQSLAPDLAVELRAMKHTLLAEGVTVEATDFILIDQVAGMFKLPWGSFFPINDPHYWAIEKEVANRPHIEMSTHTQQLFNHYIKLFSRESNATCRTAIDLILLEVFSILKINGNLGAMPNEMPQTLAQNSFSNIRVYGEVAFKHLLLSSRSRKIIFNGCVDYAIGRAFLFLDPYNPLQKHFQSLVLLVEAKVGSTVERAVPQLLIYLASIRQSREARGRTDTAVYGVASDGFRWKFVMITHSGLIKVSAPFSITFPDGTKIILECLAFMVEAAASMLPTSGVGEHTAGGQWDIDDPSLHIGRNTESDDESDDGTE